MNNLCQLALANGGSVNYLTIPGNITEGLGLTNPSILYQDGMYLLNLRHVQYALYHSEGEQRYQTPWGPLAYLNPEDDVTLRTTNYLCQLDPNTLAIDKYKKVDTSKLDKIENIPVAIEKLYRADITDINGKYLAKTVKSIDIGIKTSDVIDQKKLLLSLKIIFPHLKLININLFILQL